MPLQKTAATVKLPPPGGVCRIAALKASLGVDDLAWLMAHLPDDIAFKATWIAQVLKEDTSVTLTVLPPSIVRHRLGRCKCGSL